jgi:uncharacterized protein (DUF952 family)
MTPLYKICTRAEWDVAAAAGAFEGSAVDHKDGFIHLSTRAQVEETARRHFAGQADLVLVELDADRLGPELRWEPSRGGDLFPHLYARLPVATATRVVALPLGSSGEHVFSWPSQRRT